ncbi:MAG: hypothetical protein K6E93_04500 [Bacteroidales bacterium]|nr:hypothetical protein [Bacteroidales bacterium]
MLKRIELPNKITYDSIKGYIAQNSEITSRDELEMLASMLMFHLTGEYEYLLKAKLATEDTLLQRL